VRFTHTYAECYAKRYCLCHSSCESYTIRTNEDSCTNTNDNRYSYFDPNSNSNTASDANGDCNIHSHSNTSRFTDTHAVYVLWHTYVDANAVYAYSHSLAHSNTDGDCGCYGNTRCYSFNNSKGDTDTQVSPKPEASSHSGAAPVGHRRRLGQSPLP
jgi:hypothetical protein